MMARLPYVEAATAGAPARDVLERISAERGQAFNVYRMLAHSPRALEHVYGLASYLWFESALDRRLQELVILRVAQLTGSDYEWARHRSIARRVGVTDEQVAALAAWRSAAAIYDARERAALAVAEQATVHIDAGEEAVAELRRLAGDQALVEVLVLTGLYGLVARVLRSTAVDPEPGDEPLPPPSRDAVRT
jgi:AhpD family alkylhydroperoxidase